MECREREKEDRRGGGGRVSEECGLRILRQIATREESDRRTEEMNLLS